MATPRSRQGARASRTPTRAAAQPGGREVCDAKIPIPVRNTFVHYHEGLSPETAEHLKVRQAKSLSLPTASSACSSRSPGDGAGGTAAKPADPPPPRREEAGRAEIPIRVRNTFVHYHEGLTPETAQHMKVRHTKSHSLRAASSACGSSRGDRPSRAPAKEGPEGPAAPAPVRGGGGGGVESPIPVRNTFVDYPEVPTPETAQHLRARHSKSGPAGIDAPARPAPPAPSKPSIAAEQVLAPKAEEKPAPPHAALSVATPARSRASRTRPQGFAGRCPEGEPRCRGEAPPPAAALGSPELPSEGSAGHHRGACRPCAFHHRHVGCESGAGCEFCHLCDTGERRRRQKERLRQLYQEGRVPGTKD